MQKIEIINLALSRLGNPTITDLKEGSDEASKAAAVWDSALESTLQAYRWGFNTRREALGLLEENPAGYPYRYRYNAPTAMLQPYEIFDEAPELGKPIPFLYEDGSIFTDKENAVLVYAYKEDRCSMFSPVFVEALSWRLVGDLAVALTQKSQFAGWAQQNYEQAIGVAKALAGNSRRPKRNIPQYIQARR